MKVLKSVLEELTGGVGTQITDEGCTYTVLVNKVEEVGSWSIVYSSVVKLEASNDVKYFETVYSSGASETQDEAPYEYDEPDENGMLEVEQVYPKEVTVTIYE